ncbi:unnamed protein product [Didymodactylos carnosus]|uniref:Small integral membrane protein 15 n=1 Tax=Didymodactylos carnosus TaxID=1234261 RepID=A0A8S2CSF5_9BILA|nr:unnamed protein product [Didymodactylos carnosus]CAF3572807.1 unnamed protein product [Didymodactylos carnosus]
MDVVVYAAEDPWTFLYYVLLCLTPLFITSAYLAMKLAKEIEKSEKQKRLKAQQTASLMKIRKHNKHE